jgi:hypothetical protein
MHSSSQEILEVDRSPGQARSIPVVTEVQELVPRAARQIGTTSETVDTCRPWRLQGASEGGTNAVGAAIAAAIDDALGQPVRSRGCRCRHT